MPACLNYKHLTRAECVAPVFFVDVYCSNVTGVPATECDHSLQNVPVTGRVGIGQPVQRTWSKLRGRAFSNGGDSLPSEYATCVWVSSWWHLETQEAVGCVYPCWTSRINVLSVSPCTCSGRLDVPATVQTHLFGELCKALLCVHVLVLFTVTILQDGVWCSAFACEVEEWWMCLLRVTVLLWIECSAASLRTAACAGLVLDLLAWRIRWYLLTACKPTLAVNKVVQVKGCIESFQVPTPSSGFCLFCCFFFPRWYSIE